MYFQNKTIIRDTKSVDAMPGEKFNDSGIVAVYTRETGKTAVKFSRGDAKEVFAGMTLTRAIPPRVMHTVIEDTVPASHVVDLGRYPISGQFMVKIGEDLATVVADSGELAAGKVLLEGDTVTFHADDEDKEFYLQMAYEPTVAEAQEVLGDVVIGGLSEPVTGKVTLITSGIVGTSFFDASCDWTASDAINPRLGADGKFTLNGSGPVLKNVIIEEAPSAENACLVVDIQ